MPRKKDDRGRQPEDANLPDKLKEELPPQALEIYRDAYKRTLEEYKQWSTEERQSTAHRIAYAAVREDYEQGEDGKWRRKGGKGMDEDA